MFRISCEGTPHVLLFVQITRTNSHQFLAILYVAVAKYSTSFQKDVFYKAILLRNMWALSTHNYNGCGVYCGRGWPWLQRLSMHACRAVPCYANQPAGVLHFQDKTRTHAAKMKEDWGVDGCEQNHWWVLKTTPCFFVLFFFNQKEMLSLLNKNVKINLEINNADQVRIDLVYFTSR